MVLSPVIPPHTPYGICSAVSPGSPHMRSPNLNKYNRPANTLKTILPGFTNPVSLPFPEKCLPVCIRCKKNYKTRELCRVRDGHTDLPWSLTYVCVTLDDSCIDPQTGRIIDGPFNAQSLDFHQPYCEKEKVPGTTPICAPCKEKNYTRAYCRDKQKHNQLPWSTVYVLLTRAHPMGPGSLPGSPVPISPGAGSVRSREGREETSDDGSRSAKMQKTVHGSVAVGSPTSVVTPNSNNAKEETPESDPLFPVPASKTFLLEVSGKSTVLRWLDVDTKNSKEPLKPTLYKAKVDDRAAYSPGHSPGATWGGPPPFGLPGYGPPPPGAYGMPPYPPGPPMSGPGPYGHSPPYPMNGGGPPGFGAPPPPQVSPPSLPPPPSPYSTGQQEMTSLPPYRSQAPHHGYYHSPTEEMPSLAPGPPPPPQGQMDYSVPPRTGSMNSHSRSYSPDTYGQHNPHSPSYQRPTHHPHPPPQANHQTHSPPRPQPQYHQQQSPSSYHNKDQRVVHGQNPHSPPQTQRQQHHPSTVGSPHTPPAPVKSTYVSEEDKGTTQYAGFEPPTSASSVSRTTAEPSSPGDLYDFTGVASWQHAGAPSWNSAGHGSVPPCGSWPQPLDFAKDHSEDDFALSQAASGMGLNA